MRATHAPHVDGVHWMRTWRFVGLLVAGYVVIGMRAVADDRYLDDEGILTYLYSECVRREFVAAFFWLRSHPALTLLNLPVGAAGIVLIAIAARRAGIREVGIAPLVMATSPLYVTRGASGIPNVDGAALAAGALGLTLPPGFEGHRELRTITQWLRDHRRELANVTVYTNLRLLDAYATHAGDARGFVIAELIQPDTKREALAWLNPANGQRERIWHVMHDVFYGRGADPSDIVEGRAPAGSLLVLETTDIRTEEMLPATLLSAHTRTLFSAPGVLITELRPPSADEQRGPPP